MLFFLLSKNMVQMVYILLVNILFLMLVTSYYMKLSWFILLFLILIVRGLLVIFSYITTLSVGEKLGLNLFMTLEFLLLVIIINKKFNITNIEIVFKYCNEIDFFSFFCCLNFSLLLLFMIILMFVMLVVNIEMISRFKSSFRLF